MKKLLIFILIFMAASCSDKDKNVYPPPKNIGQFALLISEGFRLPEEAAARYTYIETVRAENIPVIVIDAIEAAKNDSIEERLYAAMGYDYIIDDEPKIIERNRIRIGIFTFRNDIHVARETVKKMRLTDGCDTVIAVSQREHVKKIKKLVNGIDLVAFSDGEVKRIDYRLDKTVTINESINDMSAYAKDKFILSMIGSFADRPAFEVAAIAPYGFLHVKNISRIKEDGSVNLIADAMYWYTHDVLNKQIDFSMVTAGSVFYIRPKPCAFTREGSGRDNSTNLGAVMRNIQEPEIILTMKGADLLGVIEQGAKNYRSGGFVHYSKQLRVEIAIDRDNIILNSVTLNGDKIDPARLYRFTLNKYASDGNDNFKSALDGKILQREQTEPLTKALDAYAVQFTRIVPYLDGRMIIHGE